MKNKTNKISGRIDTTEEITGKLENTAQLKKVKKEIARCYTVLTERSKVSE